MTTLVCMAVSTAFLSSDLMAGAFEPSVLPELPLAPVLNTPSVLPKPFTCHGAWAEGFVSRKTKDDNLDVPGYELLTGGGIMGLEWQVCPKSHQWQVGIAIRYDSSDLDGNSIGDIQGKDLNFDSTRGILYTHINFNNPFYLTGFVSYAFNQYFVYQNLTADPFSTLWGDYDGQQWTGQVELGYEWSHCDLSFRPQVSLYYSHFNTDAYKQITADIFNNQQIEFIPSQSDNAFFVGLDLNLAYTNHFSKAKVIPFIHAKVNYQTIEGSLQSFIASNAFGEGTSYIYSASPPTRTRYQVGGGIEVLGDHEINVVMSYDYSFKPGEHTHALLLSIKHDW